MRAAPVVAAAVVAISLVGAYVALGGTSYEPSPVADPCAPRPPRDTNGTGERLELVLLAASDATACELGVSREELVLALRSEEALTAFSEEQGLDRDELEQAITDGLVRAVDDAEEAGSLPGFVAPLVRRAAESVPPWLILETLESLGDFLPG